VVEILSPSSVRQDQGTKDPKDRVFESYELANLEYRLAIRGADSGVVRAAPFSDLAIPLGEIWESGI